MSDVFHGDETLLTSHETPSFSLFAMSAKVMIFNVMKPFMKLPLRLKMATGKIRADINFINPYSCAKIRARARARNPQRVGNDTRTRYPRIPAYPRARPHTRKF